MGLIDNTMESYGICAIFGITFTMYDNIDFYENV